MELTPEERQRIYLEEQARMDARRDIKRKRVTDGKIIWRLVMGIVGVYVIMLYIGQINRALESPLARAREEAKLCIMAAGNDPERLSLCVGTMDRVLEEEQRWKIREAADLSARDAAQATRHPATPAR
jgi:hypothetical protein